MKLIFLDFFADYSLKTAVNFFSTRLLGSFAFLKSAANYLLQTASSIILHKSVQ